MPEQMLPWPGISRLPTVDVNQIRRALLALPLSAACAAAFAQPALEPVRFALIEAFSGPFANAGEAVFRNILWATERVNQRGGVRVGGVMRPLAVVRFDSKGNTEEAVTLMRAALASVADTVLIPMQDILGLGSEARMNLPGRLGGEHFGVLGSRIECEVLFQRPAAFAVLHAQHELFIVGDRGEVGLLVTIPITHREGKGRVTDDERLLVEA